MANMAWNSTMNTVEVRKMLNDTATTNGEYKIPFIVVCDAFQSEMTAFADLVLPDTTYLERHDVMSMLDRPISEFDGPIDSVRVPVVPPKGECKPFQEVLIELAVAAASSRRSSNADGTRKFRDYPDFIVNYETEPGSGIGFLAGWRGKDGDKFMRGEPNPRQWEMYAKNNCVFHHQLPPSYQYMRNWNRGYMEWAQRVRIRRYADPIVIQIYSEVLQKFRLAAQGKRQRAAAAGAPARARRRPTSIRCRSTTRRSKRRPTDTRALSRSPRSRSGRWRCTTRGTRRTRGCARSTRTTICSSIRASRARERHRGRRLDVGRVAVGQGALHVPLQRGGRARHGVDLERDRQGARAPGTSRPDANESRAASCSTTSSPTSCRRRRAARRMSNSDPVTGQAGWYDVRVRIYKAGRRRAARDVAAVRRRAAALPRHAQARALA